MSEDVASTRFEDDCPITGQPHRYFIFKTFETFEPASDYSYSAEDLKKPLQERLTRQLYEKKEYAVLGCNCGSVIRQRIQYVQAS